MKYRVGDRVYCIKDRESYSNNVILYSKGDFYTIKNYRDNYLDLSSNFDFSFSFSLYDNVSWCFNEYFITLKEFRKQKLDKLNEI